MRVWSRNGAAVRALIAGAVAIGSSAAPLVAQGASRSELRELSRAWPVMGTMLTITVWGRDTAALLRAAHEARDSIRLVDSLMSNFRPESEISRLNRNAGGEPQPISAHTMHVLLHARRLWRASNGLFDPTIGPIVRAWGFYGDSGRVPPRSELDSLRQLVGYGAVALDTALGTARLSKRGMELDLGGIAKGYALDLARSAIPDTIVSGGMIDLGGNILVFGRPPHGRHWIIGIRDPREGAHLLGTIAIDSGAVATSGDYEHFFRIGGVRYGHLIDPRTGYPRRGVLAVSAVGPRGEWSDGVSALLFLAGAERGRALADSLVGVAGIWVLDHHDAGVRPADIVLSRRSAALWKPQD